MMKDTRKGRMKKERERVERSRGNGDEKAAADNRKCK